MNLRHYFRFPASLQPELRSNFTSLFWDIGWWGLYIGSTLSFLPIYATRSGATPEQIGLLTALPAVLTLILSLPVGRFLNRIPAGRATVLSALVGRSLFGVYVLLPWVLPPARQVGALLAMAIILALPNTVIGISFSQFFVEAVPGEWRGMVVGMRNAIMSLVTFPITLLSGQILKWMEFPSGYQVVFLIGFMGAILTIFPLIRVRPYPSTPTPRLSPYTETKGAWLPAIDGSARIYLKVIGLLFLLNLTNNMVAPLIPDLLVRGLSLSDVTISIGTALTNLLVFLVSLLIARITRRTGNRKSTAAGTVLLAFQTVCLAFARDAVLYLAAAGTAGIASGILSAAQYNYHLDNLPPSRRSSWLSWNLMLGNAAVLLGALAGPYLARGLGTSPALLTFAALRLGIGVLIFMVG